VPNSPFIILPGRRKTGALMISRAPTTFAVGFLLLDALLLAYSGFALGRRWLVSGRGVSGGGSAVVFGWRRYVAR